MKTKTDNHIDTVLRSVMERRAEKIPVLSDNFAQEVMSKMNARRESAKPKRPHSSLFTRRFAAILSIAAVLFIAFILWPDSNKDTMTQQEVKPVVAETNPQPVPQPTIEEKKDETLAEVQPMPKPLSKPHSVPKAVEQKDTPVSASPADSFDYYLAHLEAEMEALDDSVSTAHLEKLISADARLQQLVNRIVGKQTEQVMNELRKDSTANYITF